MKNGIGSNITRIRISRGMTEKELALKSGLSVVTICKYEKEKSYPRVINLWKLAKALECDLEELTGE